VAAVTTFCCVKGCKGLPSNIVWAPSLGIALQFCPKHDPPSNDEVIDLDRARADDEQELNAVAEHYGIKT
jgi:hypothetical protein